MCLKCGSSFSINYDRTETFFWIPHIDGLPFRKLGDERGLGGAQAYNRAVAEIQKLPDNTELTKGLCDPIRFSRRLVIDGKYIAVKDFGDKIPFIYGIDYLTHDIPFGGLFLAEDSMAFVMFFDNLKLLGYNPEAVIADDRSGLKPALLKAFPLARLQLCQNHYLEKIRQDLKVRTDNRYAHFYNSLSKRVFQEAKDQAGITEAWRHVWKERTHGNRMLQDILKDIDRRRHDLFACLNIRDCPNTTNIIESYNSHLQGRLDTIKGFQSFESAQAWLNAYLIRRRTKILTDCKGKFKLLNKHCSLEFTIKKQAPWPDALTKLGIKPIKFSEKSG